MSRSPFFASIRSALRLARHRHRTARAGNQPTDIAEVIEQRNDARLSRRRFLQAAGLTVAGLATGIGTAGCKSNEPTSNGNGQTPGTARPAAPRVAVIGAGVAGLNAAYQLQKQGVRSLVFEADTNRVGGRMHSATDLLATGVTTELGGEFINTDHEAIHELVKEFGFPLLDMEAEEEEGLTEVLYWFGGQQRSMPEIVLAFSGLAGKIDADAEALGEEIDHTTKAEVALTFDRMSIAEYFDQIGAEGWVRDILDVAWTTEYGLDIADQSALNFILEIDTGTSNGFAPFAFSDERYKVKGGNAKIPQELARRLGGTMRSGHRLVAMKANGLGFTMTFDTPSGTKDIDADVVVCAVPFSVLRKVDLSGLDLPAAKRTAINELGYGTNAKLLWGVKNRIWRDMKLGGAAYADTFHLVWDHSRQQGSGEGGQSIFWGGTPGVDIGEGSPESQVQRWIREVENVFPGISKELNGNYSRFHWPSHPTALGSYSCPRPGQWTTIVGVPAQSVGNLIFCGEHTSADYWGFMNGAAESGKRAAQEVLALVKGN